MKHAHNNHRRPARSTLLSLAAFLGAVSGAAGQVAIVWQSIDGGGGRMSGGALAVDGCAGQPDAAVISGGSLQMTGGYWFGLAPAACYANCDSSTTQPLLNVLDFGCFLNKFAAGDPYANCDGSTTAPVLNVLDFGCFLNKFAAGCP